MNKEKDARPKRENDVPLAKTRAADSAPGNEELTDAKRFYDQLGAREDASDEAGAALDTASCLEELGDHVFSIDKGGKKWADERLSTTLYIGFDSEWHEVVNGSGERERRVLSYSTFVIAGSQGENGYNFLTENGQRWTLGKLLEETISAFRQDFPAVRIPGEIILVGHYTFADISALEDWDILKKEFDALSGTYLTMTDPLKLEGSEQTFEISLRDTLKLAPQGSQALENLGEMIGLEKVELPDGMIEHMDVLLRENGDLYEKYAKRDSEIAVKYYLAYAAFMEPLCDAKKGVTLTLAGAGLRYVLKYWKDNHIDLLEVMGKEVIAVPRYDRSKGKFRTRNKTVKSRALWEWERLATEAYHGGMNQCFEYGPSQEEELLDFDLKGAYPTALASMGMPIWREAHPAYSLEDFTESTLGFARVDFDFPKGVKYPCLPQRSQQKSLVFTRMGQDAHVTAAEIAVARHLGAKIKIRNSVIVPTDPTRRPFEPVFKNLLDLRKKMETKFTKASPEAKLVKELSNSIYGKTAQGLQRKRVFDSRTDTRNELDPSQITQPFVAGYTTGLVRACLAEILNKLPANCSVGTVTTDGFFCNAKPEEVERAAEGEVCAFMRASRERLTGDPSLLEIKHAARQTVVWRRRSLVVVKPSDKYEGVWLAKAGIKPPVGRDKSKQAEWLLDRFLHRSYGEKFREERLVSLFELYHEQAEDFMEICTDKRLGLDYDFSCRPDVITTREVRGVQVVHFTTRPWDTLDDYEMARKHWDYWSRENEVVMHDEAVVRQFMDRLAVPGVKSLYKAKDETTITRCVRMFIRAYRQGAAGLSPRLKPTELAERIVAALDRVSGAEKAFTRRPPQRSSGKKAKAAPQQPKLSREEISAKLQRWAEIFDALGPCYADDDEYEDYMTALLLQDSWEVRYYAILQLVNNAGRKPRGAFTQPFQPKVVPYTPLTGRFMRELDFLGGGFQPQEFFKDYDPKLIID